MAHISTKGLSDKMERALRRKLVESLRIIGKDRYLSPALNELLTFTESTMLAKRLAVIYLTSKGQPILDICDTLNVSSSTVLRIQKTYRRNGYGNLKKVFRRLEPSILEIIEIFLGAGMPPIVGPGRHRGSFKEDEN
jgi:uncharacterized protein YerC